MVNTLDPLITGVLRSRKDTEHLVRRLIWAGRLPP